MSAPNGIAVLSQAAAHGVSEGMAEANEVNAALAAAEDLLYAVEKFGERLDAPEYLRVAARRFRELEVEA